jgi:hypothetical protein
MPPATATLKDVELRRLQALVEADEVALDALHSSEFVLVHPGGGVWSKDQYIGGVVSGEINYRRFDALSDIETMVEGNLAVLRYRSAIDIHVQGQEAGALECWHTDCYRRTAPDAPWRVVWSQATAITAD